MVYMYIISHGKFALYFIIIIIFFPFVCFEGYDVLYSSSVTKIELNGQMLYFFCPRSGSVVSRRLGSPDFDPSSVFGKDVSL